MASDAELRARALARWEGEGGALAPTEGTDGIDETSLRILARLGAALLEHWAEVPEATRTRLVRLARSLGRPGDGARAMANLDRFLEAHRSDC